MSEQALGDLRIIEYGDFISGPFCAKLLADLGADVIKIEEPLCGDSARRTGPFFNDVPDSEGSGLFLYLNTNKRGITLNLGTSTGVKVFRELVRNADVLIENTAPQTMTNLGLDYGSLSQSNPRLVMTSVTPFGQVGPYSQYKANDLICCNMTGLAYHTPAGGVENPAEQPPLKPGGRQSDFITGSTAAAATLFAVIARDSLGAGQQVDVSHQESVAAFLRSNVPAYTYDSQGAGVRLPGGRQGSRIRGIGYLPCRDGHIVNGCREEYQWRALLELAAGEEWEQDARLQGLFSEQFELFAFLDKWETIRPVVLEWTMEHTKEEIASLAQSKGIPIVPANSAEDIFNSRQFAERGFLVDIDHPHAGRLRYPGAPYKLSGTPWQARRCAPLLGQHNEEVLCGDLGYSEQDLTAMRAAGVI